MWGEEVLATITIDVTGGTAKVAVDEDFRFAASNYPNPFNPETTIRYVLPERAAVRLSIFNALGQQVRTLVDADRERGVYLPVWDGRDDAGFQMGSGVYFYRLEAGEHRVTGKMFISKWGNEEELSPAEGAAIIEVSKQCLGESGSPSVGPQLSLCGHY